MARIFITGSADGLGQAAARRLVALGHEVVLHGRNRDRAQQALRAVPGARTALEGDLASMEQTGDLEQAVATQVWLAISEHPGAKVSGRYLYRKRTQPAHAAASDVAVQDAFLAACEQLTRVRLPTEVTK